MDNTETPGIEKYIEDDPEQDIRERYDHAQSLLMEIIGCGYGDVDTIMDMIRTHGDLLEVTGEYVTTHTGQWTFEAFVAGVKRSVLAGICDYITDDLYEALAEVQIDDNYVAWGGVADHGGVPLPVAEIFAEICREGVTDERVERLIEADREIAEGTKRAEVTQAEMRRNGEIE